MMTYFSKKKVAYFSQKSHCCCCVWRSFQFSPSAISWKDRAWQREPKTKGGRGPQRASDSIQRPRVLGPQSRETTAPPRAHMAMSARHTAPSFLLFQASCVLAAAGTGSSSSLSSCSCQPDRYPKRPNKSAWRIRSWSARTDDDFTCRRPQTVVAGSLAKRAILQAPEHKNRTSGRLQNRAHTARRCISGGRLQSFLEVVWYYCYTASKWIGTRRGCSDWWWQYLIVFFFRWDGQSRSCHARVWRVTKDKAALSPEFFSRRKFCRWTGTGGKERQHLSGCGWLSAPGQGGTTQMYTLSIGCLLTWPNTPNNGIRLI